MFTFEVEGFDDIAKKLNDLESEETKRKYQEGVLEILRNDLKTRFLSSPPTSTGGEVYGGVYWRGLREGYLNSRPDRKHGQVLIDSGALRDSLVIPEAPHSVVRIEGDTIELGTDLEYAEELNRTWQILLFHDELINKLTEWTIQFYVEGQERPNEF